jgi:hypothetical protein
MNINVNCNVFLCACLTNHSVHFHFTRLEVVRSCEECRSNLDSIRQCVRVAKIGV